MLSVGAILFEDRFCASRKGGYHPVGGYHPEGDNTWWLLQLAVEKSWSMPGGPLFCYFAQTGLETLLLPCRGFVSDILGSFQTGGALFDRWAPTIECLLMSGCGQGNELVKQLWNKLWFRFPGLTPSRSGNTGQRTCLTWSIWEKKRVIDNSSVCDNV